MNHLLITFEGIDGCGKSTQAEMLKKWFAGRDKEVTLLREPGGVVLSEKIRELLLNPDESIDPVTELLLFSAARSQLVSEKIRPLLDRGVVVILDRFYDSTTAYQGYGRQSAPLEEIRMLNRMASHGLVPDFTFYLKITPEGADRRLAGTGDGGRDRIERSGSSFFHKVAEGFDEIAHGEERLHLLDAEASPDAIHRQIIRWIENELTS